MEVVKRSHNREGGGWVPVCLAGPSITGWRWGSRMLYWDQDQELAMEEERKAGGQSGE